MQEYNNTDRQLHLLSQIIAKANRTFVAPVADDSHTNLFYDSLGQRLYGRWLNNGRQPLILSLNLVNQHFEWLNSSLQPLMSFSTTGKTTGSIEAEIAEALPALALNPRGFTDGLHFQIPDYPFAKEPVSKISDQGLASWTFYRKLANDTAAMLLGHLQVAGEVRIWPHHFDTGIYVEVANRIGIGFGLAMEDKVGGAPYFYLSGYPLTGSLTYNNLPAPGKGSWHTEANWQGVVLPINRLAMQDSGHNEQTINAYLLPAITWFLQQ